MQLQTKRPMVMIECFDMSAWMKPQDRPKPIGNKMPIVMYAHLIRKPSGRYQWQYEYNVKQLIDFTGSQSKCRKNAKLIWSSSTFEFELPASAAASNNNKKRKLNAKRATQFGNKAPTSLLTSTNQQPIERRKLYTTRSGRMVSMCTELESD